MHNEKNRTLRRLASAPFITVLCSWIVVIPVAGCGSARESAGNNIDSGQLRRDGTVPTASDSGSEEYTSLRDSMKNGDAADDSDRRDASTTRTDAAADGTEAGFGGSVDSGSTVDSNTDRSEGGTADSGSINPPPEVACPVYDISAATGSVYYVCDCEADSDADCQAGDDGSTGTSPESALRTYARAREQFASIAAGDIIAFCRGGSFVVNSETGTRWVNDACRADNPCVVQDYQPDWGSGDEQRPIITVQDDSNGIALEDGGNADHEEGYVFLNLDLRGSGSGWGFFIYNDIDDVLLCNLSIDNFDIGVHAAGSNEPAEGSDGLNERIVLRNSRITNNSGQGWLGGCSGCSLEYCYFENNGFARSVLNHNIYISGSNAGVTQGMRAVGNELYRSAIVGGECSGVSLVVHGEHEGLLIEGNVVREDQGAADQGCWGIAVDTGYLDSEEAFSNVTVRSNTVINVGNVAIGLNACDNCLVENNVVIVDQRFSGIAIAVPNRDREDIDQSTTGVTVRNNSIFVGANSGGTGIRLGGEGSSHVLVNNAIHYAGSSAFSCFNLDLPPSSYAAVDNNLCYFPNASGGNWEANAGALSSWQSSSGMDAQSQIADPLFRSITGPGYDLSSTSADSPLVNAGHLERSASDDRDGLQRDANPDIGAYEL